MYYVWSDLPLPSKHFHLLDGLATVADRNSANSLLDPLNGVQAIIAGGEFQFDGNFMDQEPTLRVISRIGIGVDNIVIPEATARGIAVCNVPDGPTISTAEHAITLIMAVAKQIKRAEGDIRRGG